MSRLGPTELESFDFLTHVCEDPSPVLDARGKYLTSVCCECEEAKLARFNPEVFSNFTPDPSEQHEGSFVPGRVWRLLGNKQRS